MIQISFHKSLPKSSISSWICVTLVAIAGSQTYFANAQSSNPVERARQAIEANDERVSKGEPAFDFDTTFDEQEGVASDSEANDNAAAVDSMVTNVAPSDSETISLNVDNQEIRVILRNIAELFELNIVIPEELSGSTSLNLRDVTWQQVFDIVLEEVGYSWQAENGIIRIRQGSEATIAGDPRVQELADGTLKIEFRSTPVATILSLIAQAVDLNVVVPPDEALLSELDLRLSGVTWSQVFGVTLGQFGFGFIDQDGIIIVKSLDQINSVPDVSRVFHVKYSEAESIAGLIESQSGVKGVVTDARSNVVVVTGNPSRFSEIKALIETLDRPTPQVMIESRFVEVSNADTEQLGLDWQSLFSDEGYLTQTTYESTRDHAGSFTRTSDDSESSYFDTNNTRDDSDSGTVSSIQSTIDQVKGLLDSSVVNTTDSTIFSTQAFNIVLRALKKLNDSKIVSNPTVLALNGQEAEIKIIDHYYVQRPGTVSEDGRVVPGEVERLDPLPGIELKVTPTISGGDFISLKVVPQVNDIVGTQVFSNGSVPIVRQRTTKTHVMVKDRETLAIGGLIDESITNQSSKIPLLGSVPGLGRLFRYDSKVLDTKNQIIFITASILNPNETNYLDVIGMERMNELGLTERDVMGTRYPLSPEERALHEAILEHRRDTEAREREEKLTMQIEAYRIMEEKRALEALEDLEASSNMDFRETDEESASAMDLLKKRGNSGFVPTF